MGRNSDKVLKRRVRRSYMVSTVSIALVLFLMGTVGYLMSSVLRTAATMRESVTMIVELRDGLTETQRDSIGATLAANEMTADVKFVSKDDKLADEEFRKAFAVDIEGLTGENPLPDSFDVTLSARSADKEALAAFVEQSSAIDGVERTTYPEMFIEKMHSVLDTLQLILLLFGGTMLVISLILLNNTIRLAIYSRRQIINTMKLVGATKWFIMKPFIGTSAKQGLCAGAIATALFAAALYGLEANIPEAGISAQLTQIGIIAGIMVVAGITVAILFTVFAVNKFVNMKSNKIYLY